MRKFIATTIMVLSLALCFGCAKNSDAPKAELPTPPIRQATELSATTNTAPSTASAESTPTDNLPVSSRTRLSFCMESVEGILYDVYIVGENEERLDKWVWRQHDKEEEIWCGIYYAYMGEHDASEPVLQSVYLFDEKCYPEHNPNAKTKQRINVQYPHLDGFYLVKDEKKEQPDILVSTIRKTGGGFFIARVFFIKDGALQLLRFMKENGTVTDGHGIGFNRLEYTEDGKLAVPWWTNAKPNAGEYTTFYDLDIDELILRSINTITRRRPN